MAAPMGEVKHGSPHKFQQQIAVFLFKGQSSMFHWAERAV